VAALWASEAPIYQRFGYGLATRQCSIDVDREHARFRDASPRAGRVRLLSREEAIKALPPVYDRMRPQIPGMMSRSPEWWEHHRLADSESHRHGGSPLFAAVVEIDGSAEGYGLYRVHPSWGDDGLPNGWVNVREALATSPAATRELWRFLFGIDLMTRIKAWPLAADHPLQLMLEDMDRLRLRVGDGLWVRIVDVAPALSARAYGGNHGIVFALSDSFCPWNEGRWRLDAGGGTVRVERSSEAAELALDACDLGALYLSGATWGELARAGRVQELASGALGRADSLFAGDRAPWCAEIF
jgi:predicted acetyltransferase